MEWIILLLTPKSILQLLTEWNYSAMYKTGRFCCLGKDQSCGASQRSYEKNAFVVILVYSTEAKRELKEETGIKLPLDAIDSKHIICLEKHCLFIATCDSTRGVFSSSHEHSDCFEIGTSGMEESMYLYYSRLGDFATVM